MITFVCLVAFEEIPKMGPAKTFGTCGAAQGYLRPFLEFLKNGRHRGNQVGLGGKEKHTGDFTAQRSI